MPPITRKRRAPTPVEDNTSSKNEHLVEMDDPTTSSNNKRKCKCSVDGCGKLFITTANLRTHYRRAHSKKKPYECTFPSCTHTSADLSNFNFHIRKTHQMQYPKEYVKVRRDIIAEETKVLGIRCFTVEEVSEDDDSDATEVMPTLPHFTTIHRTSKGHFICPFSDCDKQKSSIADLKIHYRVHCGSDYRPFRCIFPDDYCRYSSTSKKLVRGHIRVKHFGVPLSIAKWNETGNDDRNESDFIDTRIDWLEMEDALFSSAQIVSSSDVQIPRIYECTFANCTKKFPGIKDFRIHRRSHSQLKPFKCSFPNCDHASNRKDNILCHIQSVHLNVPAKKYKNLSKEEKQRAEQYVDVKQDVLDDEETQMSSFRNRSKPAQRKRNVQSTNTGHDDPSLIKIPFEDEETSEDEDDKDKLALLLVTVQPTTSN